MGIIDAIPRGKENAVHQWVLCSRLGLAPSTLKAKIRIERRNGVPIIGSKVGYFIAATAAEKMEFISILRKQAFTRLESAKAMLATLEEMEGQLSFSDIKNESPEVGKNGQE